MINVIPLSGYVQEYHILNTHDDGFNINGFYFTTTGYMVLCDPWYDCYTYLLFKNINATNPSEIKNATLSIYCRYEDDENTTKYVTVYGLENPAQSTLFTEPSGIPYTDAYTNIQVNIDWDGWKNVTVTNIVKEMVGLPSWGGFNKHIPFVILGASGNITEQHTIMDWTGSSGFSAILYVETYDTPEEKPYEGGWDHGEYVNSTDEYDIWKVWNGTQESYIFVGSNLYYSNGTLITTITGYRAPSTSACSDGLTLIDGMYYLLAYKIADTQTDILNSTDLVSWDVYKDKLVDGYNEHAYGWYKDIAIGITHRNSVSSFLVFFQTYNITSKTSLISTTKTSNSNGKIRSLTVDLDRGLAFLPHTYSSATYLHVIDLEANTISTKTVKSTYYAYTSAGQINGSDEVIVLYWDSSANVYYKSYNITSDSFGSEVSVDTYNSAWYIWVSSGLNGVYIGTINTTSNMATYHVYNGLTIDDYDLVSASGTGAGTRMIHDKDNVFTYSTGGKIYQTDGVEISTTYDAYPCISVIGSVTANYTQYHYFNCTWTDPYEGGYTPPPPPPEEGINPINYYTYFYDWYGLIGLVGMIFSIYQFYNRLILGDLTNSLYAVIMFVGSFCIFYGWVIRF